MTEAYGSRPVKRHRRTNAALATLDAEIINAIRDEHPVSLRGVYYRVVSAGAVEKTENGYRLVGRELLKLRRAGVVPYSWITDGTRWITEPIMWASLDEMLANAALSYRRALWQNQPDEVLIFTEKDAISGVVRPVTQSWGVPLGVLRGYSSETFAYSVARAVIAGNLVRSGMTYVYQLGDHDPSGVDAWRAFTERVSGFIRDQYDHGDSIEFERLAVTEQQITEWSLPTRPTKQGDARAKTFVGGSVEVDAIAPSRLRRLVEDAITGHVDQEALRLTRIAEKSEREILARMKGLRS
jgi:hypothetical protein